MSPFGDLNLWRFFFSLAEKPLASWLRAVGRPPCQIERGPLTAEKGGHWLCPFLMIRMFLHESMRHIFFSVDNISYNIIIYVCIYIYTYRYWYNFEWAYALPTMFYLLLRDKDRKRNVSTGKSRGFQPLCRSFALTWHPWRPWAWDEPMSFGRAGELFGLLPFARASALRVPSPSLAWGAICVECQVSKIWEGNSMW